MLLLFETVGVEGSVFDPVDAVRSVLIGASTGLCRDAGVEIGGSCGPALLSNSCFETDFGINSGIPPMLRSLKLHDFVRISGVCGSSWSDLEIEEMTSA